MMNKLYSPFVQMSGYSVVFTSCTVLFWCMVLASACDSFVLRTLYFASTALAWCVTFHGLLTIGGILRECVVARDVNFDVAIPTPIGYIRYFRRPRRSSPEPVLRHQLAGNDSDFDTLLRLTNVFWLYDRVARKFGYTPVHSESNLTTIVLHSFASFYVRLRDATGLRMIGLTVLDFLLSLTRHCVNKKGHIPERELYSYIGSMSWEQFRKCFNVGAFKSSHDANEFLVRLARIARDRFYLRHQADTIDPDDIPTVWEKLMAARDSEAINAARELLKLLNSAFVRYACGVIGVDEDKTAALCEKIEAANVPLHAKFLDQLMAVTDVMFRLFKSANENGISSLFSARPGVLKLYKDVAAIRERIDNLLSTREVVTYLRDLQSITAELKRLINLADQLMDSRNTIPMLSLQKQLLEMKATIDAKYAACQIRKSPFGILLVGPSGVCKSHLTNMLNETLLCRAGVLRQGDSATGLTSVIQSTDKYHSTVTNATQTIILDDLANKREDKDYVDVTNIISFLNNVSVQAVKAEVHEKGTVFPQPKLAIATTNVKHLNAPRDSNCPISILRRFNVCVDIVLKPEFRMVPQNRFSQANTSLLPDTEVNPLMDVWEFHFYRWVTKDRKPDMYTETLLRTTSTRQALDYIIEQFDLHQEIQTRYVQSAQALSGICGCGKFEPNCQECALRHQFGFVGLSETLWYKRVDFTWAWCNVFAFIPVWYQLLCDKVGDRIESIRCVQFYRRIIGEVSSLLFILKCVFTCTYLWVVYSCAYILSNASFHHGMLVLLFFVTFIYLNVVLLLSFMQLRKLPLEVVERCQRPWKIVKFVAIVSVMYGAWCVVYKLWTLYRAKFSHNIADVHPRSFNPWKVFGRPQPIASQRLIANWSQPNYNRKSCEDFPFFEVHGVKKSDGKLARVNIAPLGGNIFLINTHFLDRIDLNQELQVKWDSTRGPTSQPVRHLCYRGDVSFIALNCVPFPSFRDNLPVIMPTKGIANMTGVDGSFDYWRTTEDHGFGGLGPDILYNLSKDTEDGMCGTPIVSQDLLIGFHNVGGGRRGGAVCVTQSDFDNVYRYFNPRETYGESDPKFSFLDKHVNLTKQEDEHVDGKVKYLGQVDVARTRANTTVKPTIISDTVRQVFGVEPKHEAPMHIKSRKAHIPRNIALKELKNPESVPVRYLGKAAYDYMQQVDKFCDKYSSKFDKFSEFCLSQQLRPLECDEVFAGIDGVSFIDPINIQTSMGFPICRPKHEFMYRDDNDKLIVDPAVLKEIEETQERLDNGEQLQFVFRASFKDEPVKIGKEKVRVFAAGSMELLYFIRKYFLPIAKLMQDHPLDFECAVGINANGSEWHQLYEHVTRFGNHRMIAGDYKAFDKGVSSVTLSCAFDILINIAKKYGSYTPNDIRVMEVLAQSCTSPVYEWFGSLIRVSGSNPSGNPLTVILNNLVNSLYQRAAFFALADRYEELRLRPPAYSEMVSAINYGDDNLMSVSEDCYWFDHTKMQNVLAEWGITYTMADKTSVSRPFIHIDECDFLKRNFRYDSTNDRMMAALDEDSIFRSLLMHTKISITDKEHAQAVIDGAQREYYQYGKETFLQKTRALEEVARLCDIPWTANTYEQLQESTESNPRDLKLVSA